jgi:DNA polymerase-3 subunit epsilon
MLRELESVDHRVCANELEAEVTELRLIAAHAPRHNRRSKPPRSHHWVKLTS